MLTLHGVHTYYGESHVLRDVNLSVAPGRALALLGRNGAGKTTTLRTIMGLTGARHGSVEFKGEDITCAHTFQIARRGVGFIPAGRRLFGELTVRQNLEIGAGAIRSDAAKWTIDTVHALFPKLSDIGTRQARFLSGGEQQMLKFARCLLSNPSLLLLDEPTEGLAPYVVREVMDTLTRLREAGISMLVCEQNARLALSVCDDACVLEKGRIVFAGPATALQDGEALQAHLGFH
jgi:branched-chain amino acid transport system ATP-binding protein